MKVDYIDICDDLKPRSSGMKLPAILAASIATIRVNGANRTAAHGLTLLADQVVASATTFLTTIIIGRACLPEELGRYTLGVSLAAILIAVPRSLIWTPYTTFFPSLAGAERRRYTGSSLAHQVLFGVVAACLISAAGVGAVPLTASGNIGRVLIVLGPAVALMHLREYARRNCFARLRARQALAIDVGVSFLQTTGLLLLAVSGTLTAVRAYMIIGSACAMVVATWVFSNRHELQFRRIGVVADFARNWRFGRLLLVGELAIGFTLALNPWALSVMHGTTAVAIYAVAQGISGLVAPLIQSFHNFFGPFAAHTFAEQGMRGLVRVVTTTMLIIAGLCAMFALGVSYCAANLLVLVYGSEYTGHGDLVTMFVLSDACFTITAPVTLGLLAVGRSDVFLKANLIMLALSLMPGLWFIYEFGPIGIGYIGVVAGLGAAAWQCLAFASVARNGYSRTVTDVCARTG